MDTNQKNKVIAELIKLPDNLLDQNEYILPAQKSLQRAEILLQVKGNDNYINLLAKTRAAMMVYAHSSDESASYLLMEKKLLSMPQDLLLQCFEALKTELTVRKATYHGLMTDENDFREKREQSFKALIALETDETMDAETREYYTYEESEEKEEYISTRAAFQAATAALALERLKKLEAVICKLPDPNPQRNESAIPEIASKMTINMN
jgi:hypothetical protein